MEVRSQCQGEEAGGHVCAASACGAAVSTGTWRERARLRSTGWSRHRPWRPLLSQWVMEKQPLPLEMRVETRPVQLLIQTTEEKHHFDGTLGSPEDRERPGCTQMPTHVRLGRAKPDTRPQGTASHPSVTEPGGGPSRTWQGGKGLVRKARNWSKTEQDHLGKIPK